MVGLHLVGSERQMDLERREWGGRRYRLTRGLPPASGNTPGTNGPSSELEEAIVSHQAQVMACHTRIPPNKPPSHCQMGRF